MKITPHKTSTTGFSLVEMLVVIAIIGIISAIAIPTIGKIYDAEKIARNQRNAQSISSVFIAAQAANLDFSDGLTEKDDIITAVMTGGIVSSGPFNGAVFKVSGNVARETNDIEGAAQFLSWDNDTKLLTYDGPG